MINARNHILNTGSVNPPSYILKSYPTQGHKLVRPEYTQFRAEFRNFSFFVVTPAFETQVVELPDLTREPELNYLDISRLQSNRDNLRLWLFWMMCQSRKKKESLANKARHIAELYLRISEKPESIGAFFERNDVPVSWSSREYDPDQLGTKHYAYQIALIARESYWWNPKGFRCVSWAAEELLRMRHITPDITYSQTPFLNTVVATIDEKTAFNQAVEKALEPYFPTWVPLGGDFKAYPIRAPSDIPRYAITREEFYLKTDKNKRA